MGKSKKELKFRIGDKVEVDFMRDEVQNTYVEKSRPVEKSSTIRKQMYKKLVRRREILEDAGGEAFGYTLPKDIRLGVITGIKIMCEGWHYPAEIFKSSDYFYGSDESPDPGGLEVVKIHYLWRVRSGYCNKEHYFFEEDIKRFLNTASDYLTRPMHIPFKDTGWNSSMADKARKDMSRWSKDFPRDSKGRWSK